jgi:trehalose 6-phosphate synthase
MDPRIVIVSNRGPNDFVWRHRTWVTRTATGGLVSMLTPIARQPDVAWFCCVSEPPDALASRSGLFTTATDQTDPRLHIVPVPLAADMYHAYYGQISNEVLWMLQHHLIGSDGYDGLDLARHRAWSAGYLAANERLAETIARDCPAPQAFLVQDYHLYPLPALLRAHFPTTPILHFTHIPFPDAALLKLLPAAWRTTILRGLLGADIVGLQTPGDVHAFLGACVELLGTVVDPVRSTVLVEPRRRVVVRAYPASVDVPALHRSMRSAAVAAARQRLEPRRGQLNVIRVDRLDPSKNQLVGFQAFARLLELRPDLQGRVRFLAFLVPSRTDLGVYQEYRNVVYRTIEAINDRFADGCGEPPIEVFYTNDRDQALAAMEVCDVLLVNSLRDGMNLVAKEWAVVSQRPGVLIVSETAGVAEEATDSALLVSPLDVEGTAQALAEAVEMPLAVRTARLARLRERVQRWTAGHWLAAQLVDLGLGGAVPRALRGTALRGQRGVSAADPPRPDNPLARR